MRRRACLLGVTLAFGLGSGCAGRVPLSHGAPGDSGILYLYLDALPDEAKPLRAEIASVDALDATGAAHRLGLRLGVLDGGSPPRQRLMATGALPAGRYRGLAVSAVSARLAGDRGPGALQTPEEPVVTDAPFVVEERGATVLSLRLQVGASIPEGIRFQPVLSAGPPGVLASGLFALATSRSDGALVVFHRLAGEVFGVLRTGPAPIGVALEADRQIAFVASSEGDSIEAFDLSRMTRDQRFPVLAGDRPSAVALSRDGRTLACAHAGSNVLGVYDAPVLAERFRVGVGLEPSAVLLDPGGRRAFVLNTGSDTLTVVDLIDGMTERTIATDDGPIFGAVDRAGHRLYVIHRDSPHVVVVTLSRLAVERRVYV
ncbi:MAG TPA: hypothetical protein VJ259_02480, partial [Actinomycetota bacterium]|nr:hypothetical protein [Actinomycetota bacterium]